MDQGQGSARAGDEAGPVRLDLRGLLCPLTWAKTRYALSRLQAGHQLLVLVDHRPAVPDIRRNSEELGHEVVSARELAGGVWELLLRRQ
jgi:tRNA 2-thiouridine synthesizing protein A